MYTERNYSENSNMIALYGPWNLGFAYDKHTLRSVLVGEYSNGVGKFDTERTEMGNLVYQLKYRYNLSAVTRILELLSNSEDFKKFIANIDTILIVPPSNKARPFQPVFEVAKGISETFNKQFLFNALDTTNIEQIKNIDEQDKYAQVRNSLSIRYSLLNKDNNYLIFDDVFDSGNTLRAYVDALKENGYNNISVFTLTTILVGDAKGVDLSIQKYLFKKNYQNVFVYYAGKTIRNNVGQWQTKNIYALHNEKGRNLYTLKDEQMANDTDYGLMIWDGESKGIMKNLNKQFFVVIDGMVVNNKQIDSILNIKHIERDQQLDLF